MELNQFVKSLESQINLVDYAKFLGIEVNRYSLALCIAHPDKNPSMWIKEDHLLCLACAYYARAIKLTMDFKSVDFKEALNMACDYMGHPRFQFKKQSDEELLKYEEKRNKEDKFYKLLDDIVKIYASCENPYLTDRRGISKELIKDLQIGATNGNKFFLKEALLKQGVPSEEFSSLLLNQYGQDFFQNSVIIPIFKSGRCIGLYGRKYDNVQEFKHLYLKSEGFKTLGIDPETTLYNFDNARKYKSIYMFESIIDCLSALSNGIPDSVAIYGTQGLKEEHLKQLKNARIEDVYLVMDGDEPGRKASIKQGYKIENTGINVSIILLPEGKDPNEYFLSGGNKESFEKLSQCSPLKLAIQGLDPKLKDNKFLNAIHPILERISTKDSLLWKDQLNLIREHFEIKPSITKLEEKVRSIVKQNELNAVVAKTVDQAINPVAQIFQEESCKNMVVPSDWMLSQEGIFQIKNKPNGESLLIPISHYPIIITETSKDIDDGKEYLALKYKKEGKIFSLQADRQTISEQKSITQLSNKGFPVHSVIAKPIIQYLDDFEAENIDHLKKSYITHCFGHNYDSKGNLIFYLPQKVYNTDENISFVGMGPGDYDFYYALHPQGSLEDWIELIKKYCVPFDMVMFNLYASFCVPLLKRFNIQKSFTIDYYGRSSIGKTTANEVAASIYGNPAKFILQWNHITQVAAEQLASLFNGIPIFLDDSQNADPKKIQSFIYMIANSVGKARGHLSGGLRKVLYWLTFLFSTGERKVIEHIKDEGASARNLSIGGSPFESEEDQKMANKIRELKKGIYKTYGVAIVPFLDYAFKDEADKINLYYDDAYKTMASQISGGGKSHRQIEYWAAILAAGLFAEEVFRFGKSPLLVCEQALKLFQEEGSTDSISEAMEDTISWINSNDNFYDVSGVTENKESDRAIVHGVKSPGEYIAVLPHILKEFLVKQGYSPKMVIKGWKDRGWIKTSPQNLTERVGFRGKHARMIKISWKVYSTDQ